MKKYSVIFLCLTAVNYSHASFGKFRQIFHKETQSALQKLQFHQNLHAQKAMLLKELKDIQTIVRNCITTLEAQYPHLKNRRLK